MRSREIRWHVAAACAILALSTGCEFGGGAANTTDPGANPPVGDTTGPGEDGFVADLGGDAACVPDCTGHDCGDDGCGGTCGACGDGEDCFQGRCVLHTSCTDGEKNDTETDVDCGGKCPQACGVGRDCLVASDCLSGRCDGGACAADASCTDGLKTGTETDVDCGGTGCPACALTQFCKEHRDCLSLACVYGVCAAPTCDDGARNQDETDVDCGGKCGGCVDGLACKAAADCTSGRCVGLVCVSCSDGVQNGDETDVDCGGQSCGPCGQGGKCKAAYDCTTSACEGGFCCSPNACGACAVSPNEVCNGQDDDCDGSTDEASQIGAGQACPLQQGVCKGAIQVCKGASGWVCDATVYKALGAYEVDEKSCDGKDNDCDGQTDEGMLNACGACGAAPVEVCNGKDDDCNGKVDDRPECQACAAAGGPVEIAKTYSDYDRLQMSWRNFLAMLGDTPYVFYTMDGYSTFSNHLVRLVDGASVEDYKVQGLATIGNPYLWPGDGFLHLAVTAMRDYGGYSSMEQGYYHVGTDGKLVESTWVGPSTNYSGAPSPVAQGGSTVGLVYWPNKGGPTYMTRNSDGTWQNEGSVIGSNDYGLQLALRKNGTAFVASKAGAFEGTVQVEQVGGQTWTVDSGKCESPSLRVAPDDTVWVVYESGASTDYDGTIQAWTLKGSTPSGPVAIGTGNSPNIAFDANGKPVVTYVSGKHDLVVATRSGSDWSSKTIHTSGADETLGGYIAIGVDSAGRRHIVYASYTPAEGNNWNSTTHLSYVLACP